MNDLFRMMCALAALGFSSSIVAAEGNAQKGEKAFKRCKTCHMVGDEAKNRVGPVLNGVIGRAAGSFEDYNYSRLNRSAGESGLVWDEEKLVPYLKDPTKWLKAYLNQQGKGDLAKGRSKMAFKLRKEQDAQNIVAYLRQFSDTE